MMETITNISFMDWVSKNKYTFLLVILTLANIYQYIDRNTREEKHNQETARLNDIIRALNEKSLEYEKQRTERYEFLLRNLPKASENETKSTN